MRGLGDAALSGDGRRARRAEASATAGHDLVSRITGTAAAAACAVAIAALGLVWVAGQATGESTPSGAGPGATAPATPHAADLAQIVVPSTGAPAGTTAPRVTVVVDEQPSPATPTADGGQAAGVGAQQETGPRAGESVGASAPVEAPAVTNGADSLGDSAVAEEPSSPWWESLRDRWVLEAERVDRHPDDGASRSRMSWDGRWSFSDRSGDGHGDRWHR